MVIQFINRKKELQELHEVLMSDKFELVVLYGRRRIGKTELILQATKNHERIYYLATEENNLERFSATCSNKYQETANLKKDYEVLFDFLKDHAAVIIIDEFQNMIKEDKNILSLFQAIVDMKLKGTKTKLFLLGSSVSIMTSKILSYKSPLYGRRTGSFNVRPISFFDLKDFFPGAKLSELMEIYGFADGIPYYLVRISKRFWQWLAEEIQTERSFLRDEVQFMMRYEFDDPGTYTLILEAVAKGNTKLNDIKNAIGVSRTDITPYLRNLLEVGFLERRVPVTEHQKSRRGRYYLKDNFLAFWFKYIYPNLSSIEEGVFDTARIKQEYGSHLGHIFEKVAAQYLTASRRFTFTKIGKWWHKEREIDIVALDELANSVLFCECKWQDKVNAEHVIKELHEKARYVPWHNDKRKESYAIFARSFQRKIASYENREVHCIDLERMGKVSR